MDKTSFFILLDKFEQGKTTPAEEALLDTYYRRLEELGKTETNTAEEEYLKEKMLRQIRKNILQPSATRGKLSKKLLYKLTAAAAVILLLGWGYSYFFYTPLQPAPETIVKTAAAPVNDIPPGRDAAILTLADGRKILLDSTKGTINNDNGVTVINLNGQLSYSAQDEVEQEAQLHTISTSRGNQYKLILSDGTKVWLNSSSTLSFPSAFTGAVREVQLTGEGYFEVTPMSKPFHVKTQGPEIEVLGTHFNINAYQDELEIITTLIEGSVKVKNKEEAVTIHPGEQANQFLKVEQDVDVNSVMAWKTGFFEFENASLPVIMRQISRWYDVDIDYERKKEGEKFGGRISRKLPLSNILQMLENSGVRFRLEGKKLTVL